MKLCDVWTLDPAKQCKNDNVNFSFQWNLAMGREDIFLFLCKFKNEFTHTKKPIITSYLQPNSAPSAFFH